MSSVVFFLPSLLALHLSSSLSFLFHFPLQLLLFHLLQSFLSPLSIFLHLLNMSSRLFSVDHWTFPSNKNCIEVIRDVQIVQSVIWIDRWFLCFSSYTSNKLQFVIILFLHKSWSLGVQERLCLMNLLFQFSLLNHNFYVFWLLWALNGDSPRTNLPGNWLLHLRQHWTHCDREIFTWSLHLRIDLCQLRRNTHRLIIKIQFWEPIT